MLTVSSNAFDIEPRAVPENDSLTYNKPVEASNVFRGRIDEYGPSKAVDGRMNTRWATDADALTPSITIDLKEEKRIGHVRIDEAYAGRIQTHALQYRVNGQWKTINRGGTVGADISRSFDPVKARRVRLNVLEATKGPTINEIRLYETGE